MIKDGKDLLATFLCKVIKIYLIKVKTHVILLFYLNMFMPVYCIYTTCLFDSPLSKDW